jgi:hypothetical protein
VVAVVDGLVAGVTDHEGLASFPGHECRPVGLSRVGCAETGEFADLMHEHSARFLAQFAPVPQEPGGQLFSRVGNPLLNGALDVDDGVVDREDGLVA